MKHHALTSRRAFTLIELLVVISIIALLIGILLPALGQARRTAQVLLCGTKLQQIGRAYAVYQNDFDSFYPTQVYRASRLGGNRELTWDDLLGENQYDARSITDGELNFSSFDPNDIYQCPLDDIPQAFGNDRRTYGLSFLSLNNNGQRRQQFPGLSGWNRNSVFNGAQFPDMVGPGDPVPISRRVEDVTQTSNTIAAGENRGADPTFTTSNNLLGRRASSDIRPFIHWSAGADTSRFLGHHAEGDNGNILGLSQQEYRPNYLYADGHVENLSNKDTEENSPAATGTFDWIGSQWDSKQ